MTAQHAPAADASGNLPSLDGLRGVALLLVLMHNMTLLDFPASRLERVLEYFLNVGWTGVQLFFVLSGFLITRGLIEIQASSNYFTSFYGRRVLRIFPLYFGTLAFIFVVLPAFNALPSIFAADIPHQVWLWTFLSNWTEPLGLGGSSLPHFWSLAVEEQFYLVWPLLIHRLNNRQVLKLCSAVAIASFLSRIWMVHFGVNPEVIYASSLSRMDALALGAGVAALLSQPESAQWLREYRTRVLLWTLGLGVAGWLAAFGYQRISPAGQTVGYSFLALTFAGIILCAAIGDADRPAFGLRWLRTSWLRSVGKYSFAMYVFHKPIHDVLHDSEVAFLNRVPGDEAVHSLIHVTLMVLLVYALAWLSYHLVEKRFLAQKWRFRPRFAN